MTDWFNILVLHQNRVKANPKNAINEHFLPRFLDFIVWGHEHECLVDPLEVPGMGFHITQPGSSVATSLIDGESKPKHVLLLEIKGNQYRPTKIPLTSVRPFEYTEIVLKDESDIDSNDQNSIIEHLDKVVQSLIEKSSKRAVNKSELKLPLVRLKVDYSGFMTINPQRFGQKYVGKVANPQDILIFSKASRKGRSDVKIDDSERLRPEELNQQNIEALVAENNLKMEILPVNDLDVALHNFVNKDDKMAFYSCVQYNLEETRSKISQDADPLKFEEEDLILKVGECLEDRVKERNTHSKKDMAFTSSIQSSKDLGSKSSTAVGSAVSFSDDEDTVKASGSKPTRGRKASSKAADDTPIKTSTRGRGRGRGRGTSSLKQTTLDASLGFRQSQRSASAAATATVRSIADTDVMNSASSGEPRENEVEEINDSSENDDSLLSKGRKRTAPRGRGRGSTQSKRGKKSDNSAVQRTFMGRDDSNDDSEDEDNARKILNKSQPRATRNYGALRKGR